MAKREKKSKEKEPVINVLDIGEDFSKPLDIAEPTFNPLQGGPFTSVDEPVQEPRQFDGDPVDGKKPRKPRKPKEDSDVPVIDGEMLLLLIDILIPMLISTTHNVISDTRVSPDDLTLTEKQRTMMKTFADKVAERISLNANPFLMLFAGLGGIYTMNYLRERDKIKKE